jgi:glycoprotein-N-acetylgalactosamine 3-beta-galactosyltransferase
VNESNSYFFLLKKDTYVIVENLKYFLRNKCPNEKKTYGFVYRPHAPERFTYEFNSGGAGYLLSSESVRLFAQNYLDESNSFCKNKTGAEDADIARCFRSIGIEPGESRDNQGRERFHPLSFKSMWSLPITHWTYKHSKNSIKKVTNSIIFII